MIHADVEPFQTALLPPASSRSASSAELRLVTWNVQHAGPERARRQARWLATLEEADVVVLTEVGHAGGGGALMAALRSHGYTLVVPPGVVRDYLVVIAARTPGIEAAGRRLGVRPHRCVGVRLPIGEASVGLVGLYVPSRGPRGRRNIDKAAFQDAVSAYLPCLATDFPGALIVVAGDLNVVEPGHRPHHRVFGDWEYRFYGDFLRLAGLVDAFREVEPEAAEHSWIGRSGDGYRFDHIFVAGAHRERLRACRYLHEPRLQGLSDHSAMIATLTVGSESPH